MKKAVALFLCLIMTLSLLPLNAFAVELYEAAEDNAFREAEELSEITYNEEYEISAVDANNNFDSWWEGYPKCYLDDFEIYVSESLLESGAVSYGYDFEQGKLTFYVDCSKKDALIENANNLFFNISVKVPDDNQQHYTWNGNMRERLMEFASDYTLGSGPQSHPGIGIRAFETIMLDDGSAYIVRENRNHYFGFARLLENGTTETKILNYTIEFIDGKDIFVPAGELNYTKTPDADRITPDSSVPVFSAYNNGRFDYYEGDGALNYNYIGEKTNNEEALADAKLYDEYLETIVSAPEGCTFAYGGYGCEKLSETEAVIRTYFGNNSNYCYITWYNEEQQNYVEEEINIYINPPVTGLEENGFVPVPDSRLSFNDSNIEILSEYGINVEYEAGSGFIKIYFDENADLNGALAAGANIRKFIDLYIAPPEGAVSLGSNNSSSSRCFFYDTDFYYWKPFSYEGIDENSRINYHGLSGLISIFTDDGSIYYNYRGTEYDTMVMFWYDEDGNEIAKEYIRVYFEPFAQLAEKITWMEMAGFVPVESDRIKIDDIEKLRELGININEDGGFIHTTYEGDIDGNEVAEKTIYGVNSGRLISLDIKIKKPEGAVSCTYNTGNRWYNNDEDYYYKINGYTGPGREIEIDEDGYVHCGWMLLHSEWDGREWYMYEVVGQNTFYWYDEEGNVIAKDFIGYRNDSYNMDKELPEVKLNIDGYVDGGYCGAYRYSGQNNAAWNLSTSGTLYIYGNGAIEQSGWRYDSDENVEWIAPWAAYRYDIKRVVVGEGISVLEGIDGLSDDVPVYFLGNAPSVWNDKKTAYILEGAEGFELDEEGFWHSYTVKTFRIEDMPWAESVIIDYGECGESLYWKLNAKGELIIHGTGEMYDYSIVNMGSSFDYVTPPWDDYRSSIKKIIFEEGITYIGLNAFLNIRISGDLILPEGLESVGSCAFQWNSFSSITLPSTLTKIHMGAFDSRTLEKFIVAEDNPEFTVKDNALFTKDGKVLVAFPGSVKGEYTVPEGVEVLDGDAFAGSNLEKIILPKSLKTIGQYAFNWVNAEVFVNSALESVESWAFYPWPGQNISVYFMNGAPASVKADSFTPPADAVVELYYYEGTEHLWEFDENGLWNGYKVTMLERPADATLSIDSASIVLGSSKHIKVTMSENSNAALMQFAVKYDPNALKVISCTAGNAVADATINTAEEGMIYFVWEALDSITEKEVLLDIEFAPAEGAEVQNTVVEIVTEGEEFFFADNNLGMLKIDTENGEIRIIDVIYGDINGDEKVNVLDANLIRRYSAKIMEFDDRQLLAADVSGDGKVNVLDANLVRRYSAKIIDIFPVEE